MLQITSATAVAEPSAFNLDLRLIANVQAHAGAQCHEAAGLLFAYHLCAEVCRDAIATAHAPAADAQASLERAEAELRRFLAR